MKLSRAYRIGLAPALVGARARTARLREFLRTAKLPQKQISLFFRLAAKTLRGCITEKSAAKSWLNSDKELIKLITVS